MGADLDKQRMINFIADTLNAVSKRFIVDTLDTPEERERIKSEIYQHVLGAINPGRRENVQVICDMQQGMLNVAFKRRDTGELITTEDELLEALKL